MPYSRFEPVERTRAGALDVGFELGADEWGCRGVPYDRDPVVVLKLELRQVILEERGHHGGGLVGARKLRAIVP